MENTSWDQQSQPYTQGDHRVSVRLSSRNLTQAELLVQDQQE